MQHFASYLQARSLPLIGTTLVTAMAAGQPPRPAGSAAFVKPFAPVVAIEHVLVLDGTGAAPKKDYTVILRGGQIAELGSSAAVHAPSGSTRLDGHGKTLIPGLVGMHEHLFTVAPVSGPPLAYSQPLTYPPLYLASGVTTARTAGTMEPYADLAIKQAVDKGTLLGPDFELTGPYLEGSPSAFLQMHPTITPEDARETVRFWHGQGYTSVKAYAEIGPPELQAAISEAHALGMKVTGHLCSVGYRQAIEFGIDNLEHGPFLSPDGDLDETRRPGECASSSGPGRATVGRAIVGKIEPDGAEINELIQLLVAKHLPVTSTLAVVEGGSRLDLSRNPRLQQLLTPFVWQHIVSLRQEELTRDTFFQERLKKEMAFERAFVSAGGTLLVGCDPTGDGHAIAGLGDQRNIQLLVEAGFSITQAIQFATLNGAVYEGVANKTGSVEAGKRADLVLLDGDLTTSVEAVEHPVIVFKNGVAYDSPAIYNSLAGEVGLH